MKFLLNVPVIKYIVLACLALGVVLVYLLSRASAQSATLSQSYTLLLVLNVLLAAGLLILIIYQLWVLTRRLKSRIFGARLSLRLLWMFALMAVVPGVIIYAVSVNFLTKSIESWFEVRVDSALEAGINLGRSALNNQLQDLVAKGQVVAEAISNRPPGEHVARLHELREQLAVQEAALFTPRGQVLAFSSSERAVFLPETPTASVLRQARSQTSYSAIETTEAKGLYARVVVPVNVLNLTEELRVLQLIEPVPAELAQDASAVQAAYRDYQQLSLSRAGLKKIFGLTLTLTLLLALLSAISLAFLLSERLSAPLSILAEGTRAVAQGNFSRLNPVHSRDELGRLVQFFNRMTKQLAEAKMTTELSQHQLQAAKAYLESILAHLSTGVLVFDQQFYLRNINPAAAQILSINAEPLYGVKLLEWPQKDPAISLLATTICAQFQASGSKDWQLQMEYEKDEHKQVLLARGTRLQAETETGYVVVFDDITQLLQAQRDAAWGEVARRLAHEIKNPLTPIQLSAERLEKKLALKLSVPDADVLRRAVATIVNQVTALKRMVDAFSEYARSPTLKMQSLDLNHLVKEVLTLYETLDARVNLQLSPALPPVSGDLTLLRQVIHNLLQNAQDALSGVLNPEITVTTTFENGRVRLTIKDNGSGFPEAIMTKAFDPYVTTKEKGTGLGLAVVKKIVDEHHGAVRIENLEPAGASVSLFLNEAKAA